MSNKPEYLQAALESECERNRQREEELLARLAEAERVICEIKATTKLARIAVVSFPEEAEEKVAQIMRSCDAFLSSIPDHAAQPAEPQPPTAGEE